MALCSGALLAWWRNAEVDALGVSAAAGAIIGALNLGVQDVAYEMLHLSANLYETCTEPKQIYLGCVV